MGSPRPSVGPAPGFANRGTEEWNPAGRPSPDGRQVGRPGPREGRRRCLRPEAAPVPGRSARPENPPPTRPRGKTEDGARTSSHAPALVPDRARDPPRNVGRPIRVIEGGSRLDPPGKSFAGPAPWPSVRAVGTSGPNRPGRAERTQPPRARDPTVRSKPIRPSRPSTRPRRTEPTGDRPSVPGRDPGDESKPIPRDETKPIPDDETKPIPDDETKPISDDETKPISGAAGSRSPGAEQTQRPARAIPGTRHGQPDLDPTRGRAASYGRADRRWWRGRCRGSG